LYQEPAIATVAPGVTLGRSRADGFAHAPILACCSERVPRQRAALSHLPFFHGNCRGEGV
jgi:hypothetical protein